MGGELKHFKLATSPVTLNVRPLPASREPADFSGLVGKFRVSASLSKSSLPVGDSTTLSVVVEGEGNIRDARNAQRSISRVSRLMMISLL